jgi:hypothetical protein
VGLRRPAGWRSALHTGLAGDLVVVLERGAADRRPEVAQPAAQLPSDLRKPLGTEHQKRDYEDEEQMRWLKNVADHNQEISQLQMWRR